MQNQYFISGIDTDCGKTYITGLLAYHLRKSGVKCITSKIVQTGCQGIAEDIVEHRRIMEMELLQEDIDGTTCPCVYSFPASPHLSAKIDRIPFDIEKVDKAFLGLKEKYEMVLTEGAGGLMVPLTEDLLTSEYLKTTQVPLILVSSSKLGSINHTLLSIEFCMSNNIDLRMVIYNQFPDADKQIATSSYQYLQEYLQQRHPSVRLIHGDELGKDLEITKSDLFSELDEEYIFE